MNFEDIFAQYPSFNANITRKTQSTSGKTSTDETLFSNVRVFIQADSGTFDYEVLAGEKQTAYVDASSVANFEFKKGDKIFIEDHEFVVIASILENSNPAINPFFELTIEQRNT